MTIGGVPPQTMNLDDFQEWLCFCMSEDDSS